jgi:SAM-dependent methyltransferase
MPEISDVACVDADLSPGQPALSSQAGLLSDSWNEHAQEWIDWVRAPDCQDSYWRFHRDHFLSLIPPLKREQVIVDIGCGEGRVARDLQQLDRTVLGVDLSPTMCQATASHDQPAPVLQADAASLPLLDDSVDCAIAFMSLQDIDDMTAAVKEIGRVLKDGASLALAIVHPLYSAGKFSTPQDNGDGLFVLKRTYFQPERLVSTDSHGDLHMTFFREHRPLQAYFNALTKADLHVKEVLELSDEDEDRHRDGIPMFLDIVATRMPRPTQQGTEVVVVFRQEPKRTRIKMPASWWPGLTSVWLSVTVTVTSAWRVNLAAGRRWRSLVQFGGRKVAAGPDHAGDAVQVVHALDGILVQQHQVGLLALLDSAQGLGPAQELGGVQGDGLQDP